MAEKRMSNSCWKKLLKEKLKLLAEKNQNNSGQKNDSPLRIAFVGVGSELNGDDAAGLWVARKIKMLTTTRLHIFTVEAGTMPESSSGPLRKFKPDWVVLVDAADFNGEPGEIRWLDSSSIGGFSASTHSLPLSVIGSYLQKQLQCEVALLGIQPESLEFAEPLTKRVQSAVDELVSTIQNIHL